jgi:hypothetical protein
MKFNIELDIGLPFLVQAALPQLITDRETKTHRRARPSDRTAVVDAALKIPEAEPQSRARVGGRAGVRANRPSLLPFASQE